MPVWFSLSCVVAMCVYLCLFCFVIFLNQICQIVVQMLLFMRALFLPSLSNSFMNHRATYFPFWGIHQNPHFMGRIDMHPAFASCETCEMLLQMDFDSKKILLTWWYEARGGAMSFCILFSKVEVEPVSAPNSTRTGRIIDSKWRKTVKSLTNPRVPLLLACHKILSTNCTVDVQ